jgi:hypothetical protein
MAPPTLQPVVAYRDLDKTIFANTTSTATSSTGRAAGDDIDSAIDLVNDNDVPRKTPIVEDASEDDNDLDSDDEMDAVSAPDSSDGVPFMTTSRAFDIAEHVRLSNPVLLDYLSDLPRVTAPLELASSRGPLAGTSRSADKVPVTHVSADAFEL